MTSSRLLRGVFFLGHPLPTVMTAIASAAFFMMARKNMQVTADTAVMFASVLLIQYSIGCMNDYVDEPLDRLAERDEKPLVSGDVPKTLALYLWVFTALSGFAASAYFNLAAAGMAVVLWLAGVTYNFWAKRTALSWLPFVVFFPSLPVWSFIAAGRFTPALLLSYPIGALLSVGLNVANTLPDLDRDLEAGLQGLTHRLGRNRALAVLWLLLGSAIVFMALSPRVIDVRRTILMPGLAAGALLLALMIADWLVVRSPASLRRTFYLSAVSSLILGCTWIASLP
jgi:4-hydroxybenzoate polyprenyltransferase